MGTLTVTKTYNDGQVLNESDLDNIKNSIETFFNTTKIDGDNIQTGGVPTAALADSAVTTVKINDLAVTTAKINDLGVTTGKINDLAVTAAKIDALAVTTAKIDALAVTAAKIAADAVTTAKILDANVTSAKIQSNPAFSGSFSISGQDTFQTTGSTYTLGSNATDKNVLFLAHGNPGGRGWRMVAGTVDGSTGSGTNGLGFSSTKNGTGDYTITFTVTSSSGNPIVTATGESTSLTHCSIKSLSTSTVTINVYNAAGSLVDRNFHFQAMVAA